MAMTITGRVFFIGQTQSIPTKNGKPFYKREIILDCTRYDPYTGEKGFENYPSLEFNGEKCKDLDGYSVGQVVSISFDLQGGFYEVEGTKKNFTRVRAYKIEAKSVQNKPQAEPQYPPIPSDYPPPPQEQKLPW